ncbi:UNVERIFIED_CONTAM: hypothetical protein Sangu_2149900 [Sesamum angustifolium]|uniref:Uncharacterized protein n=1 Tax=Sesamum angustifolium TaxID=2727405 RepID=A0AAW2LE86_9LAMI
MVKRNASRNSILAVTKSDSNIVQKFIGFYTSLLGTEDHIRSVDEDVFEWGPMLSLELASELCWAVTPA